MIVVFSETYPTGERRRITGPSGSKGRWVRDQVCEWFTDCQDCDHTEGPFTTREDAETARAGHRC